MENISIQITDKSKLEPFINFLNSLDFVKIKNETNSEISDELKAIIEQGEKDLEEGNTTTVNFDGFEKFWESL